MMTEPSYYEELRQARETLMQSIALNLGESVIEALNDPEVIEITLNPDGRLWVEKFGQPMIAVSFIPAIQAESALHLIASAQKAPLTREFPILEGLVPLDGSRIEGLLPPVVDSVAFAIRKKASKIFTFEEYVQAGILAPEAREILEELVTKRRSLLVAGCAGAGKSTFINAVIEAVARLTPQDRLIIIEDVAELQSSSQNRVELRTTEFVNMERLLRVALRLRPDRIILGEVRDVAALALVKSWNTGHFGGLATLHANNAPEAMIRLEELIAEGNYLPQKSVLARAINFIVFINKDDKGIRRLTEIVRVGYDEEPKDYAFTFLYRYFPESPDSFEQAPEGYAAA
jgi:type IV secretion system protein VirB11